MTLMGLLKAGSDMGHLDDLGLVIRGDKGIKEALSELPSLCSEAALKLRP